VSTKAVQADHGKVTKIVADICYPDGSLKSVEWGTTWIAKTTALILIVNSLDAEQKSVYPGKRRFLRKRTWKDRPTLVRQTIKGPDQLICSIRDFAIGGRRDNGSTKCVPYSDSRGALIRMVLNVFYDGRRYAVNLDEQTIKETAALVLPQGMNSSEKSDYDQTPNSVAVRRLVVSAGNPDGEFALVCRASPIDSLIDNYSTNASCGLRGSQLVGPR
jgi:hypothetical protein